MTYSPGGSLYQRRSAVGHRQQPASPDRQAHRESRKQSRGHDHLSHRKYESVPMFRPGVNGSQSAAVGHILPPCSHTAIGSLASGRVPAGRAMRRLKQFSLTFVTRLVNGNTSPRPCGHQAPGKLKQAQRIWLPSPETKSVCV